MVDYFSGLGIVTYHIYQDGKIEKHIPEKIFPGFERKYQYVYHDKDNNEHEICICEWHTINKKVFEDSPRATFNYPDHGTVKETKTNVSDGYIVAKAKYTNGDIHEWIKIEEGVSIKYELKETFRKYINPDLLAGFIGALAEIKENIIVTGSAYEQGSCFPSSLHINGLSIDTKYIKKVKNLTDYKKDKEFVNALAKFHFRTFRVGKEIYNLFKDISGTKNGGDLHNSHLHTENFDFNTIKIIE
ncbi:hypothetical protein J3U57_02235 [Gilliamella sp. B3464]|uniref:hypothetical protein n=1 Tax=unclassified Gilliamella TaxID=2685620 RepID=UPI0022698DB4|nr:MULTISPECIES: hypothetical protein [unclassified Gilliamella]MCX8711339.1 hypothetical protein [Gilliamella sp. B3468]MCX8750389.1 hypothetical protein [Gilliamella sp. B3464]